MHVHGGGGGSQRGPAACSKLQPEIVAVLSPPPRRCRGGAGGAGEGHSVPGIQSLPGGPRPSPRCQGPEEKVRGRKHLVMWKAPRKVLSFQRKVTEIHSRREHRSCPTWEGRRAQFSAVLAKPGFSSPGGKEAQLPVFAWPSRGRSAFIAGQRGGSGRPVGLAGETKRRARQTQSLSGYNLDHSTDVLIRFHNFKLFYAWKNASERKLTLLIN